MKKYLVIILLLTLCFVFKIYGKQGNKTKKKSNKQDMILIPAGEFTIAQWEKAARGTEGYIYPWGNKWDKSKANNWDYTGSLVSQMANMYKGRGTLPVGSFSAGASPYGVMDMAGNVYEWVSDWYDDNYYKNSPSNNPTGAGSGTYKVLRAVRGAVDMAAAMPAAYALLSPATTSPTTTGTSSGSVA